LVVQIDSIEREHVDRENRERKKERGGHTIMFMLHSKLKKPVREKLLRA
jgi:hypothetical protein